MKSQALTLACVAGLAGLIAPSAKADLWNHKTKLTFNEPVEVPGKVLPAGTYIFKLMDSQADRHIVQIYNADESQIIDTVLAVPNKRLQAKGKTDIRFSERPAGSPEAIQAWFYPGSRYGEEFVYPHERAGELAKANKRNVLSTRSDMSPYMTKSVTSEKDASATEMRKAPVMGVQPTGQEIEIIEIYKVVPVK